MGMGFAPTWLRQVSPPASQNHFSHWSHLTLSVLNLPCSSGDWEALLHLHAILNEIFTRHMGLSVQINFFFIWSIAVF